MIVSIITPVYNSEMYIKETIKSVCNQTHEEFELILVDNCSDDRSVQIIKEFVKNDNRIKLIELEKNYGPAIARNFGIKAANGQYISFLDSDDVLNNNYLKSQIEQMTKNEAAIVYSSFVRKSENFDESYGVSEVKNIVTYKDLLKKNYLSCLTTMIDVKKTGKFYFKEGVNSEDHLYWLELLRDKNICAIGNTEVLATYRIRKNSLSRNKLRAAIWKWNIYRKYLKLNIIRSIYYFVIYSLNGILSNYKFLSLK